MDSCRALFSAIDLGHLDSGLMHKAVVLSDGQPCRVRQLGLFELDGKGQEILGPYRYSVLMATGQVLEAEYDLRTLTETPRPPDTPVEEIQPGTWEHTQLQEYETYLAALAHERTRLESYEGYQADIAAYVLANCLEESDRRRIVEPDDWRRVYEAAIVPQLTQEVIAQTLRDTFPGLVWQLRDTTGAVSGGAGVGDGGSPAVVGD